jgi:hypothetical protein
MHSHGHEPMGSRGHRHDHDAAEESYGGRRHPEHVVLDIGGAIGALIVHTASGMHGAEIEISPSGRDDRRSHKDVLEREINGLAAYTAVFDKVGEGSYTLWVDGVAVARDVVVTGGAISELDWSATRLAQPLLDAPKSPQRRRGCEA